MENTEIQVLERNYSFDETGNKFIDFIKNTFTDPKSGIFYKDTAFQFLESIQSIVEKHPDSIDLFLDKNLMLVVSKFASNPNFFDENRKFAPKPKDVIVFVKEEFGVDLLNEIPAPFRPLVRLQLGL